jgi:hypothetical protein
LSPTAAAAIAAAAPLISDPVPASVEIEGGISTSWIRHVKAYARAHKMSYRDALSAASASWRSRSRR